MMADKVTIENINGKLHTVVWYCEPYDLTKDKYHINEMGGHYYEFNGRLHAATCKVLPALPENPKVDNAKLLNLYAAHGLYAVAKIGRSIYTFVCFDSYGRLCARDINSQLCVPEDNEELKIIGVINSLGQRVEVAIIDREGE